MRCMHEVMWSQELQRLQAKTPTSLIRPLSPYLRSHAPQASPACDRPPTARGQPTVGPGTAPRSPPPPPPHRGSLIPEGKGKGIWRQLRGKRGKNCGQTSGQVADRTSVRRTGGADRYRTGVCPADRWTGQTPVRRFFTGQVSVWRLSAIFARLTDPTQSGHPAPKRVPPPYLAYGEHVPTGWPRK